MPHPAPTHIYDALKNARLLNNFTSTGLQILASIALEKNLPRGTPLFVANMMGEGLFVIAEGQIGVTVRGPFGSDVHLMSLGPGESLGEAALLRGGPRMCSAIAESQSLVLEITRRDVANLQRSKPQACLKLMMGIVDLLGTRLHDADDELRRYVEWRTGQR